MPEPKARAGEAKLRVPYNGICGSDLHEYYDGPITTRATEPMSVAFHTANRCRVEAGQTVAIHGAGPIGVGI